MAHQKGGDGCPGKEASQNVRPVVAVLSHADHAHQEGRAQQGQAERGFDQAGALHTEHECHVHLWEPDRSGHMGRCSCQTRVDTVFTVRGSGRIPRNDTGAGG